MMSLLEIVARYFRDNKIKFQQMGKDPVLIMEIMGKHGNYRCMALVGEEQRVFIFRTKSPVNAPEDKRAAMAEYLTRVNYGLALGNFELNYRDGEIAFKTSLGVQGDKLTPVQIRNVFQANVVAFDRYFPGCMEIIYGNTAPEAAVGKIRGN